MARRRWVQQPDGSLLEVSSDYVPTVREARYWNPLAGDRLYDGAQTTDGHDISSRTKHREYMRRHNLTTVDDFTNTWAKARAERAEFYRTGGDHQARREAVERAFYNQTKGK